mmetsp:Transcript_39236/g.125007  ORF Transcript_39236/g.125007 Transcript_39236/m.125007 type:complete len:291 (+) Transcript_39236:368-1240(+)
MPGAPREPVCPLHQVDEASRLPDEPNVEANPEKNRSVAQHRIYNFGGVLADSVSLRGEDGAGYRDHEHHGEATVDVVVEACDLWDLGQILEDEELEGNASQEDRECDLGPPRPVLVIHSELRERERRDPPYRPHHRACVVAVRPLKLDSVSQGGLLGGDRIDITLDTFVEDPLTQGHPLLNLPATWEGASGRTGGNGVTDGGEWGKTAFDSSFFSPRAWRLPSALHAHLAARDEHPLAVGAGAESDGDAEVLGIKGEILELKFLPQPALELLGHLQQPRVRVDNLDAPRV